MILITNPLFQVFLALFAVAFAAPQKQEIEIISQENNINPDGSYAWSYKTGNGINAEEQGNLKNGPEGDYISAQGSFAYTADDGSPISLTYVADENGFQPKGDHLPTSPPIPQAILRAIEWNAAHPEQN